MAFVAAVSSCVDETDLLKHGEVLRDRLSGQLDVVVGGETAADREQRLLAALGQDIEDRPACWCSECVEDVCHIAKLGK